MNPSAVGISDAIIPYRMLSNYFIMHNKCKIFILAYIIILKMYAIYSQSCKTSFTSHIVYKKECMLFCWPGCLFYTTSTPSYLRMRNTPGYCPPFPHHHGYSVQNEPHSGIPKK